ncbi:MAG TPA: protein kinase [Terriglobales bacterium]
MALPALVPAETHISNYTILSKLASGGMGVVYKAFDERLRRVVALKFLSEESGLTHEDVARLLREARAASVLEHENIVSIHAVEECPDGRAFIVMSFYEGENLALRMSHAPLTMDQALSVVRQIGAGLAHAHVHSIIHRDIKPSNVILSANETAKIVDFGLARQESEDATRSIGVSGTLPYMSPEQVSGDQVDHRTDIWSLGVVMYELLTNRHPFQAENPAATVAAISKALPRPMGGVPLPLQLIVYKALSKLPADRYQHCKELIHDLDAWRPETSARTDALESELKKRIQRAGPEEKRNTERLIRWVLATAIVLAAVFGSAPVRRLLEHETKIPGTTATTQAAYAAYERGMDLLYHFYRPDAINLAMAELNKSITADPKFAPAYVAMAKAYFYQYRLTQIPELIEQADAYCQKALTLDDQLGDVHVVMGRVLIASGKNTLAQSELQKAVELDPKSAEGYLALGDLYSSLGRSHDAELAYEQGIALNPDSWEGYYREGNLLIRQQRYEAAIRQYKQVLTIVPDHAYARTNMAVALKELHRTQEAEGELRKALEYNNRAYSAYANLANILYEQRRFTEAAEAAERALEINRSDFMVWNNLGIYREWAGHSEKADEAYRQALVLLKQQVKLNPSDSTLHAFLAVRILKQEHDKEKALSHLRTALALQPKGAKEPKDGRVLQIAGEVYFAIGDQDKAFSYVRQSQAFGRTMADFELDPDLRLMLENKKWRTKLEQLSSGSPH